MVSFASSASLLRALTSDTVALKSSIDTIGASGGTNLSNGMSLALSHLDSAGRDEASQVIVFLTDGVGTYSTTYTTLAANRGVIVFTIGLGTGVDQALLQGIANGTGGQYFPVASADQLEDVFLEIGGEVTNEDQDGDGLTNCEELDGMRGGNGVTYHSNPTLPDTDGDLLPDGVEIGQKVSFGIPGWLEFEFYPVIADPDDVNSDPDPNTPEVTPDDAYEYSEGSNPLLVDSDREDNGQGPEYVLDDGTEFYMQLDPTSLDTDGDDFDDYYEVIGIDNEDPNEAARLDLDPLRHDSHDDLEAFTKDYIAGFACGDKHLFCPWLDDADVASVPYIFGAIASGFGGPIPDARDLLGDLAAGDLLGAGIGLIGFVPIFGDAIKGPDRAIDMLKVVPDERLADVLEDIDDLPLPEGIADDIIDGVLGSARTTLKNAGMTDEAIESLRFSRVNLKALAEAVENARPSTIAGEGPLTTWKRGEQILRESDSGFLPNGHGLAAPGTDGPRNFRIVDAWNPDTRVALESKVGAQRLSPRIQRQIDKDAELMLSGDVEEIVWHFFPSATSGKIADDANLFAYLVEKEVPFEIHLP